LWWESEGADLPEPNACALQEISMPTTVARRSLADLATHFDLASLTDIALSYGLDLSAVLF
jgi:hypothetical protein